MQPKDIYKGYKGARKVLIGIQYENVFKMIGVVHVILAFLKLFLLLKLLRRWLLVLVLLRRINVYSRSQRQNQSTNTHTCKQEQKLRNSTTIHKNSKKN